MTIYIMNQIHTQNSLLTYLSTGVLFSQYTMIRLACFSEYDAVQSVSIGCSSLLLTLLVIMHVTLQELQYLKGPDI